MYLQILYMNNTEKNQYQTYYAKQKGSVILLGFWLFEYEIFQWNYEKYFFFF